MIVPSYDDLTPGIPDEIDPKSSDQLALFLRTDLRRRSGDQEIRRIKPQKPPELLNSYLFACLRGSDRAALLTVARDFSPRVMVVSESEVLLDVSGLGALIGPPPKIEEELRRALKDIGACASVAIAQTQTVARLLATQDDLTLPPSLKLRRASRLPTSSLSTVARSAEVDGLGVGALRHLEVLPPAMNVRDRERPYEIFEKWGIATLGELAALPPAELSSRLGRRGVALHRLARGLDARPFVPDGDTPRFIERLELEWPLDALEPLSFVLARLLDPLSLALERADRGAVAIRLDLRLTDRSLHQRILQLPAPMRDPKVLRTLLLLDLESSLVFTAASEGRREPPRSGGPSAQRGGGGAPPSEVMIDIVTIELDPAPARITQFSLLQRALPSPETLSTLTARLSALIGESRIGSPSLLDSHRADAFEMRRYQPDAGTRDLKVAPTGREVVLRRQRIPPTIRVSVEKGRPVHLAASKRGMPHGAVIQAAGPWRTSGDWWDRSYNRDEWDVALGSGVVCRIFHDRVAERWFLEAIYD